jgi:hypothetical protein
MTASYERNPFQVAARRSHISKRSDVLRGAPVWRCSRLRRKVAADPTKRTSGSATATLSIFVWRRQADPVRQPSRLASGRLPRAVCMTDCQFDSFEQETGHSASARPYTSEDGDWREREDRSWHNPGFEQERSGPVVCMTSDDAKA